MGKKNLTYQDVRELEPQDPKIDGYFTREARDLCAKELLIEPLAIDTVVAIAKYILHMRPRFVSDDDQQRFIDYARQGVIFTPNHSDFTDILTIGTLARNYAHIYPRYVGKASLPVFLNHLGLIPIDRAEGAHMGWLKALIKITEHTLKVEGRSQILFPEGVIYPDDNFVHELQPGVVSLAKTAKIVPIGIHGTAGIVSGLDVTSFPETLLHHHDITVAVGEPIDLNPKALKESGYDIPEKGSEQKEFMTFLLQVLMQEQLNRAVLVD